MIIDTHAHINMKRFDQDIKEIIENARLHDVKKMVVVGMDRYHNIRAIELAEQYDNVYASVGVHPVDVDKARYEDILDLVSHPRVVAIGETGIDLYWHKDNLEKQKEVFIKQIELAIAYNLPIIIHTRDSFDETYTCVKPFKGKIKGVFHCLSTSLSDAKKVIELGMYVGIGGVVTYPKATNIHQIAKEIPLEWMLVETDSPFLPPVPHRGMRNEPAYTSYVVERIAELRHVSVEEVKQKTSINAMKLFKLED